MTESQIFGLALLLLGVFSIQIGLYELIQAHYLKSYPLLFIGGFSVLRGASMYKNTES
jgi:hypothetical protein